VTQSDFKFYDTYFESIYDVLKEEEALEREGHFIFDCQRPDYPALVEKIKKQAGV
jgi:hypothetical protein